MAIRFPDAGRLAEFLEHLHGRAAEADDLGEGALEPSHWVGVYRDNDGRARGLCALDPDGAVALAAALSMMPPAAAQEAAASGELEGPLRAHLAEVLNICVGLLSETNSVSMRLREMVRGDALPDDAAHLDGAPARKYRFGVGAYGGGEMVLAMSE